MRTAYLLNQKCIFRLNNARYSWVGGNSEKRNFVSETPYFIIKIGKIKAKSLAVFVDLQQPPTYIPSPPKTILGLWNGLNLYAGWDGLLSLTYLTPRAPRTSRMTLSKNSTSSLAECVACSKSIKTPFLMRVGASTLQSWKIAIWNLPIKPLSQ